MKSERNAALSPERSTTKRTIASASEMLTSSEQEQLLRVGKEQSAYARDAFKNDRIRKKAT